MWAIVAGDEVMTVCDSEQEAWAYLAEYSTEGYGYLRVGRLHSSGCWVEQWA